MNKGWKTRYFCARNESDNYAIDYFETESRVKKKGTIYCCGHTTEEFSPEEEDIHGRYGLKISPTEGDNSSSHQRVWWLRCENEDERADWLKLFLNACQKATPPAHSDPLISSAFRATFRALRWHHGFSGWYRDTYTEPEHLARLCTDILAREVLHTAFTSLSESSQKANTIKLVQKNVDAAVTAAATKAWTTSVAACLAQKEAIEEQVRSVQTPLVTQEASLADLVVVMTQETVGPFLRKTKSRVCLSILRSCEHSVTNAFVTSVHGFHDYMSEQIREKNFGSTKEAFQAQMTLSHRSVEEWWAGPLEDTNQVCWAMYTNDLSDIAAFFVAGYSAYNLYSAVLDSNRKLMHRALSMFARKAEAAKFQRLGGILKQVLYFVIHDAKLYLRSVLHNILIGFLQSAYEGEVIVPCLALVQPLQHVIDDLPAPIGGTGAGAGAEAGEAGAGASLLLLPALAERQLWKLLHAAVAAMVEGSHADNCAEIDTTIDLVGAEVS